MEKKKMIALVVYSLVLAMIAGIVGYEISAGRDAATIEEWMNAQTFYATIVEMGDDVIKVQGMDLNDYNHRAEFMVSIRDETEITWRGEAVSFEKLKAGMHISLTYDGNILETYPAQIQNTLKMQVLDDEW